MPLHRLFEQRGENFVQQRSYAAESVRFLQLFRSEGPRTFLSEKELRVFQTTR